MSRWVWLLLVAGCHKASNPTPVPAPSASPAVAVPITSASAAAVDAAAPRQACSEPTRIVQLGTMRDEHVGWHEDLVNDGKHIFDPETLTELGPLPPPKPPPAPPTQDRLATGERVTVQGDKITAGTWSASLRKGESFSRVESGRWVVISCADTVDNGMKSTQAERVIDGTTGKPDARRFIQVLGDHALAPEPNSGGVTVWDLAAHTTVMKDVPVCTAGGTWEWSLSPLFLQCESNRAGTYLYDLRTRKETLLGQTASMSPGETYFVTVPGGTWGGYTDAEVTHTRTDTGRSVTLTKDVTSGEGLTLGQTTALVAFCGSGQLFALVDRHELSVHRGADGARLATAPVLPGGALAFSASGKYLTQSRAGATTVFRLEP